MNTVAERLKYAREKHKDWSQGQLAVNAGLTPAAISNIERGIRLSKGSLPQLAEALGISHKWLAYGEGEMQMDNSNPPKESANDGDGLTPLARSLGELFDTLPRGDLDLRAKAFSRAADAILLLKDPQPDALPTEGHQSIQEKQHAKHPRQTTPSK